jgi:hypothetical protein
MIPIGTRVELAPHLDLWARGARYGVLERYRRKGRYMARNGAAILTPVAMVRLDQRPHRLTPIFVTDLKEVGP